MRRFKAHAFGLHLSDPLINQGFFKLEVWDTIAQQAADTIIFFKHSDGVTCTCELLRARQACWARTNHRNGFTGFVSGRLGHNPAFGPSFVNNCMLDGFDPNGIIIDVQCASRFARRGTNTPGKFWKIVSRVKHIQSTTPILAKYEVVPVGDDVVNRAAVITKRYAAIHAARRLFAGLLIREMQNEFTPMFEAARRRFRRLLQTIKL